MNDSIKVTVSNSKSDLQAHILVNGHQLLSDEPVELGGKNEGPTAEELLASSLATCTTITLRMYMNYKKITTVEDIQVEVVMEKDKENGKTTFKRTVKVDGDYGEELAKKFLHIANVCPVHKILSGQINIETEII